MPAPKKRLTLADLDDDTRRALLEEARDAAKHNPTDVEGYDELGDEEKAIRNLMDARDHMRGCPVQEGTILGRIEAYDSRRPPNPLAGRPTEEFVGIVRCIECGGCSVLNTTVKVALEAESVPAGAGADETP